MAHRRCYGLFHLSGYPPSHLLRRDYQHRTCQCGKHVFTGLFASINRMVFQNASCFSMQFSSKLPKRTDAPPSVLSWVRFLLSRMNPCSLGREQNTSDHENRDD